MGRTHVRLLVIDVVLGGAVGVLRVIRLIIDVTGMKAVVVMFCEGRVEAIPIVRGRVAGVHRRRKRVEFGEVDR